jgi:DNA polymerase III subunit epsilon
MTEKRIFVDVETTGLDCKSNGIIQLAGIIKDGDLVETDFNYQVSPFPDDVIDVKALEVGGHTQESIRGFESADKVFKDFIHTLGLYVDKYNKADKFQFVAYNARFDDSFLRQWFLKNGEKYYGSFFWFPPIDVMNMAAVRLESIRPQMKDFKLMTVAKEFGISIDESRAHDAMYDIQVTRKLFDILTH